MMKWIVIFAVLISGGILGYMYYQLELVPASTENIPPPPVTNSIRIYDAFNDGVHRYDGQIRLPHSCFSLKINIAPDPKDSRIAVIALVTKDNMLDLKLCAQITTSYPFEEVYDAPGDTAVRLTLNGEELPVRLVKTAWQNPKGAVVNTSEKTTPAQ